MGSTTIGSTVSASGSGRAVWLLLAVGLLIGAARAGGGPALPADRERPEVVVYAAASLRDALRELAPAWERESGAALVFQFGASNDLARQIVAAPRADAFVSAGEKEVELVEREGLAEPGTRRVVAENRLVVVEPYDEREPARSAFARPFAPRDLAGPSLARLSIAHPEAVPAGRYAKAWLESQGLLRALEPRVLPGVDVRAALAAVESGGAQAGIVYRTDAAASKKVRVLHEVPAGEGPRIVYPAVCVRGRPQLARAKAFLAHVEGAAGRAVLARHGFLPPRAAGPDERR